MMTQIINSFVPYSATQVIEDNIKLWLIYTSQYFLPQIQSYGLWYDHFDNINYRIFTVLFKHLISVQKKQNVVFSFVDKTQF